jgi:hypothetical protein
MYRQVYGTVPDDVTREFLIKRFKEVNLDEESLLRYMRNLKDAEEKDGEPSIEPFAFSETDDAIWTEAPLPPPIEHDVQWVDGRLVVDDGMPPPSFVETPPLIDVAPEPVVTKIFQPPPPPPQLLDPSSIIHVQQPPPSLVAVCTDNPVQRRVMHAYDVVTPSVAAVTTAIPSQQVMINTIPRVQQYVAPAELALNMDYARGTMLNNTGTTLFAGDCTAARAAVLPRRNSFTLPMSTRTSLVDVVRTDAASLLPWKALVL